MKFSLLLVIAIGCVLIGCQPASEPAPTTPQAQATQQPDTATAPSSTAAPVDSNAGSAAGADSSNSGLQQLKSGDSGGY
ncbi:MAG: hypothetical protein ACKVQS_11475 [Fimbriimonadaceae bacterium]